MNVEANDLFLCLTQKLWSPWTIHVDRCEEGRQRILRLGDAGKGAHAAPRQGLILPESGARRAVFVPQDDTRQHVRLSELALGTTVAERTPCQRMTEPRKYRRRQLIGENRAHRIATCRDKTDCDHPSLTDAAKRYPPAWLHHFTSSVASLEGVANHVPPLARQRQPCRSAERGMETLGSSSLPTLRCHITVTLRQQR